MILLDADILLIDIRYPNDQRFSVNRRVLDELQSRGISVGVTAHVLLEVLGILSFNVSPRRWPKLPRQLCLQYGLAVIPDPQTDPGYADCTFDELLDQMGCQMALGDAVQAVQIKHHVSWATCLLTWNATHFVGKLPIPV